MTGCCSLVLVQWNYLFITHLYWFEGQEGKLASCLTLANRQSRSIYEVKNDIKYMSPQTLLCSLAFFFLPPPGLNILFCRVSECRTMKFDTDSKKPKRIKCNHFLWSFNFSSFTIRWDRQFPQYLANHQIPKTLTDKRRDALLCGH